MRVRKEYSSSPYWPPGGNQSPSSPLTFTAFGFGAQAGDCELNLTQGEGTGVQPAALSTGRTTPSLRGKTSPLRCQGGLCTVQLPRGDAPRAGARRAGAQLVQQSPAPLGKAGSYTDPLCSWKFSCAPELGTNTKHGASGYGFHGLPFSLHNGPSVLFSVFCPVGCKRMVAGRPPTIRETAHQPQNMYKKFSN